jgi:hypothetical protein
MEHLIKQQTTKHQTENQNLFHANNNIFHILGLLPVYGYTENKGMNMNMVLEYEHGCKQTNLHHLQTTGIKIQDKCKWNNDR